MREERKNAMIVDRIEGKLAVVELDKGKFVDIPAGKISGRVRDGAVLVKTAAGRYRVDEEETARRAQHAASLLDSLFGNERH